MLLITRLFKSCGINNALDGTEDDLVWDDDEEEEDKEEPIDNEFETDGSAELSHKRFFSEPPRFFLEPTNQIKSMINVVCLLFIHLPVFIYIFISV